MNEMKYFCKNEEREGSCYIEFRRGDCVLKYIGLTAVYTYVMK